MSRTYRRQPMTLVEDRLAALKEITATTQALLAEGDRWSASAGALMAIPEENPSEVPAAWRGLSVRNLGGNASPEQRSGALLDLTGRARTFLHATRAYLAAKADLVQSLERPDRRRAPAGPRALRLAHIPALWGLFRISPRDLLGGHAPVCKRFFAGLQTLLYGSVDEVAREILQWTMLRSTWGPTKQPVPAQGPYGSPATETHRGGEATEAVIRAEELHGISFPSDPFGTPIDGIPMGEMYLYGSLYWAYRFARAIWILRRCGGAGPQGGGASALAEEILAELRPLVEEATTYHPADRWGGVSLPVAQDGHTLAAVRHAVAVGDTALASAIASAAVIRTRTRSTGWHSLRRDGANLPLLTAPQTPVRKQHGLDLHPAPWPGGLITQATGSGKGYVEDVVHSERYMWGLARDTHRGLARASVERAHCKKGARERWSIPEKSAKRLARKPRGRVARKRGRKARATWLRRVPPSEVLEVLLGDFAELTNHHAHEVAELVRICAEAAQEALRAHLRSTNTGVLRRCAQSDYAVDAAQRALAAAFHHIDPRRLLTAGAPPDAARVGPAFGATFLRTLREYLVECEGE